MSHRDHEARMRSLGAAELELAADRLKNVIASFEQEVGCCDIGVVLTPWEKRLRDAARDERNKAHLLYAPIVTIGLGRFRQYPGRLHYQRADNEE